jgi:hypothetical protein
VDRTPSSLSHGSPESALVESKVSADGLKGQREMKENKNLSREGKESYREARSDEKLADIATEIGNVKNGVGP